MKWKIIFNTKYSYECDFNLIYDNIEKLHVYFK